jgi:2-polyprenyl-3-methyl-5-hydroxy-6-metoxy-1,4-benzoquinol methylase
MNPKDSDFILDFNKGDYPYLEELNDGILKYVTPTRGDGVSILDVGAGRGVLGETLCARGFHVSIIESNATAAKDASAKVNQVICADLHDMNEIHKQLKNKQFDYIIFSDILEHVFDPLQVLRDYLPFLAEDGKVLVSLPNALNWLNRCCFMLGMFHYKMTGVMDRTHVRFFTFKTAQQMLAASPYVTEKVDSTPFIIRAFLPIIKSLLNKDQQKKTQSSAMKQIIDSPFYHFYKKYLYPIEYRVSKMLPSLLAFRIILVAHKKKSEALF